MTEKAEQSYVDTKTASLASGSPKGTYATLSALQTAIPTGNTNIYVVTADGNWYYWNGSAWTAGGIYQSIGIADGTANGDGVNAYAKTLSFLASDLVLSNAGYDVNFTNSAGHKLIDYVNAVRKIGEMYSPPVCDLYANAGITKRHLDIYTVDGLHPNNAGYERAGGYLTNFIKNVGR